MIPHISRKGRSNDVLSKTEKNADDEHKSFDLSSWKVIAKSNEEQRPTWKIDNLIAQTFISYFWVTNIVFADFFCI